MKVEEAKRKECRQIPAFMQSTSNANLIDAGSVQFIPSKCSANECMHWRWNYEAMFIGETIGGTKILANGKGRISETDGYCGLAGKEGAE